MTQEMHFRCLAIREEERVWENILKECPAIEITIERLLQHGHMEKEEYDDFISKFEAVCVAFDLINPFDDAGFLKSMEILPICLEALVHSGQLIGIPLSKLRELALYLPFSLVCNDSGVGWNFYPRITTIKDYIDFQAIVENI